MVFEHAEITKKIIGAVFEVHSILGYGFLEKVYQKAMLVELKHCGVLAELEKPVKVDFKVHIIGDYFAGLLVEEKVEFKRLAYSGKSAFDPFRSVAT